MGKAMRHDPSHQLAHDFGLVVVALNGDEDLFQIPVIKYSTAFMAMIQTQFKKITAQWGLLILITHNVYLVMISLATAKIYFAILLRQNHHRVSLVGLIRLV